MYYYIYWGLDEFGACLFESNIGFASDLNSPHITRFATISEAKEYINEHYIPGMFELEEILTEEQALARIAENSFNN